MQPVTRGNASKEEAKNRNQQGNYLVYVVSRSEDIKLNNVWINGELHAAVLKEVATPVLNPSTIQSSEPGRNNKPLVPSTSRKVYQLVFTALTPQAVKQGIPKKFAGEPVVLELQHKSRKKFLAIEQMEELEVMPLY